MRELILLCGADPSWNFQLRVEHGGGVLTEEVEPGDLGRLDIAAEHLVRRFRAIESNPAYRRLA